MHTNNSLTIGVPVRNESRTLEKFIDSLRVSVDLLPANVAVETIICINSSTDDSQAVAERLIQKHSGSRFNLSIVQSQEGKMEAQRTILLSRRFHGMTAFFDADIIVHRHCLLNLWNAMEANPSLKVAYSRVKILNHGHETIVEWIESVHYAFPHFLTPRKYFHGRGYFIRPTELFFLTNEEKERANQLNAMKHCAWMRLDKGPLVDDIYISRALVHRYGSKSIQEVSSAIVEFTAPRTLRDFYHGQRRLLIELRRLFTLFPEYACLQKDFRRKLKRKQLCQASLSVRFHHSLYRLMERCVRAVVRMEIFFLIRSRGKLENLWVPLESTKDNTGGKMLTVNEKGYSKLNLGCGRDVTKKFPMPWLNVDADGPAADALCDLRQLPQEWTETVDEVRASHVLEHFFLEDMPLVLAEWRRVLVPGGTIRVIVPDLKIVADALVKGVDSKRRKSGSVTDTTAVFAQIYGVGYETSKTDDAWRHRFLFNEDLLKELLVQNGFQNIRCYNQNEDPAKGYGIKDDSQNPFSLCVIAQKPKR